MTNSTNTTKISSIFLAAILVAGTITAIYPSSFIIGINAQTEPYYEKDTRYSNYEQEPEHMDKSYSAYEPDYPKYPNDKKYSNYGPDYPPKYTGDRKYNSYESDHYGMDNDYDKKTYDYESKYSSYGGKDDKSKKDDNKVEINNIKCINTNLNINGNNTGDINLGNKGAPEGHLGGYSSGSSGYDNEGYDNGYKQGEGFECIINNNNINTNIITGGGNATNGNETETITCEECFAQVLNSTALTVLNSVLETRGIDVFVGTTLVEINSLAELCDILENVSGTILVSVVTQILRSLAIILTPGEFLELVTCIGTAFGITIPPILGPITR